MSVSRPPRDEVFSVFLADGSPSWQAGRERRFGIPWVFSLSGVSRHASADVRELTDISLAASGEAPGYGIPFCSVYSHAASCAGARRHEIVRRGALT